MLKEERQRTILNEVELHNRIQLTDIAEKLDVSIDTVRRDVKELDVEHKLRKVHGGAVSLGFANYSPARNKVYALEEKIKIAEKAVNLLKENSVVLIDGGTTCLELA
ncbi:MAG: DeoR family transcriptional regulator, partial [Maribacter sp.]